MKKFLVAILASAFSLFGAPAFAGWDLTAMNQQIDQTNFVVNGICSGTLIDKDNGLFLTANHCIDEQFQTIEKEVPDKDNQGAVKKIKIKISVPGKVSQLTFDGPKPVAENSAVFKVKAHDPDHDLALVQSESKLPNTMSAPLACKEPVRGETVYAVGNPFVVLYSSVTKGIIASVQRDYRMIGIDQTGYDGDNQPGENGLIQHTAPIAGGNSGGALYNENGELIGVNVRGSAVGSISLAVPLDDIRKFLTDNKVNLPTCP